MIYFILIVFSFCFSCSSNDATTAPEPNIDELYFPPINSNDWDTKSVSDLNWNVNELQPLLDFLEENNTKSFIILHDGKIVVEEYMNDHSSSKPWYWASAGKTLTTAITGIAHEEGLIDINNKVSDYLGAGWTSAPLEKENLITCKNLLSMDSGLDESFGNNVEKQNLIYKADAGTRWAYSNVYVKMQDVVAETSNITWSDYFNSKLRDKIGMNGAWLKTGGFSVYWSSARSMARFGLLISADGIWKNTQIIPENFLNKAINTSQNMNKSYGYLWWLNGKDSYKLPSSQVEFQGKLIPNAPNDLYAGLGKNDQKIYVVSSKKLVVIRMGDAVNGENFALSNFDNDLWEKINALID